MLEVSLVLVKQKGRYALQQRNDLPSIADPGMVSIWGGAIERSDKSPADAACRELLEETGLKIGAQELVHLISYDTKGKGAKNYNDPVIAHIFFFEADDNTEINCFEGERIFWANTISEVPEEKRSEFLIKAIEQYEQTR